MNLLALDTTTKILSLGVYKNGAFCSYSLETGRRLSELITVTIKRALEAASLDAGDIDYFVCGLGPGSFTGIRVGLATAKGLAFAKGRPIIGIPTLEIIAENAAPSDRKIYTLVDAKRDLIYCGLFEKRKGNLRRLAPETLITLKDLIKKIETNAIITGDALALYKDDIARRAPGAIFLDKDCWYPKGHNIIKLALLRLREKKIVKDCKPLYLYPKECQIRGYDVRAK